MAELSVTIDGVSVIIDSGRVKEMVYDQERNISLLKLAMISKSSAVQRKGRAGRTSPGICYRLFEKADFENMEPILKPEIQRMHLGLVILQAMSAGIRDVLNYDFIDQPDPQLLSSAMDKLNRLKLVDKGELTPNGKLAAELNLEPSIARILIESIAKNCRDSVTKIIAMLSSSSRLFEKKMTKNDRLEKMAAHSHEGGDFLTYLGLFNEFRSLKTIQLKNEWCKQNHYAFSAFKNAQNVYDELTRTTQTHLDSKLTSVSEDRADNLNQSIIDCICAGLHPNLAFFNGKLKDGTRVYKIVQLNQEAFIDNSSCMISLADGDANAELVLFSDLFRIDKLYMRNLTPVSFDLLRKYSNYDLTRLASEMKTLVSVGNLNPFIVKMLDHDWFESLESQLGYHAYKRGNTIYTEVPQNRHDMVKNIIVQKVADFESRKKRELFDYQPDGQTESRIIFGPGFQIKSVLLRSTEFVRINVDNLHLSVIDSELHAVFRNRYGELLDWRVFDTTLNPTKTGYVIFSEPSQAMRASREMQNFVLKGLQMKLSPSNEIGRKLSVKNCCLIGTWHLSPPTGRITLNLRSSDLKVNNNILGILRKDGYAVQQELDKNDANMTRLILSGVGIEEEEFKQKYAGQIGRAHV